MYSTCYVCYEQQTIWLHYSSPVSNHNIICRYCSKRPARRPQAENTRRHVGTVIPHTTGGFRSKSLYTYLQSVLLTRPLDIETHLSIQDSHFLTAFSSISSTPVLSSSARPAAAPACFFRAAMTGGPTGRLHPARVRQGRSQTDLPPAQ